MGPFDHHELHEDRREERQGMSPEYNQHLRHSDAILHPCTTHANARQERREDRFEDRLDRHEDRLERYEDRNDPDHDGHPNSPVFHPAHPTRILISPGHGAGWITWAPRGMSDAFLVWMLTYEPLVRALEHHAHKGEWYSC
jgi:hypothetical protein